MKFFILPVFILLTSVFCAQAQVDKPGTGTISGLISDAGDQPVAGARVLLLKLFADRSYDARDIRNANSDADGKYEFRNVQQGDYWVAVQPDAAAAPEGKRNLFYFPGTMSGRDAYVLRVGPNAVLTAINVRCVAAKQGFEARGRVLEQVTRKPMTHMQLSYGELNKWSVKQDVQTDEKGLFVIGGLDPGKYWVAVSHERSEDFCYPTYFEIIAGDVSDLQIPVYKGPSLRGRVVLDKGIPGTLFSELNVVFQPKGISEVNQHPTSYVVERYMEKASPVSVDGDFVIKGLPPIIGKLSLQRRAGIPLEKFFVRIEQNGMNLSGSLRVKDKDIDQVVVRVSEGKGKIRGKVTAVNSVLDLGSIKISISLQNDGVAFFGKSIPVDANGGFALDGLIAGPYRVMAVLTEGSLSRRIGDVYTAQVREGEITEIEIVTSGR